MKLADFRNLDFNRAGSWPQGVKITFCVLLFLVVIGVGYYVKIRGQREELKTHEARQAELLATFTEKQKRVVNLDALKLQLEEMQEIIKKMIEQLPSKTEMDALLVDISQTALSSGLDNQKFEPGPEVPKELYIEKPIALKMVGGFHQFGHFVSGVASLPRVVILTMHDISLTPENADASIASGGPLVLEGTVKTYRYLDPEEVAAAEAAASELPAGAEATPAPGGP